MPSLTAPAWPEVPLDVDAGVVLARGLSRIQRLQNISAKSLDRKKFLERAAVDGDFSCPGHSNKPGDRSLSSADCCRHVCVHAAFSLLQKETLHGKCVRLLGYVRMLGPGVYLELLENLAPETIVRQHALDACSNTRSGFLRITSCSFSKVAPPGYPV